MQRGTDAPARDIIEDHVRRAQQGDASSFAGLYESFYDKMFPYVQFKTGNTSDAEDIAEEVFLRMLESINTFKWQGHPFSSWLFRIAHNLVVDYFRKKSRQKTAPLEEARAMIGASSHDMDSDMDIKLSFQRAHRAMDGLTVLQREVLSLRFGAGLSIRETAESIGKKENAIKAAQHAAIKKLRTLLERPGEGPSDRAVPNWSG